MDDEDVIINFDAYPSELIEIVDGKKVLINKEDQVGYKLYKNFIAYFNLPTQYLTYTTFKNLTYNDESLELWSIKINSELDNTSSYNNFDTLFDLLIFVTNKRKRSLAELKIIIVEFLISQISTIKMHENIRTFYGLLLQGVKNINDLYNFINKITVTEIDSIIPIEYFYTNYEDGIINVNAFPKYLFTTEINYYNEEVLVFKNLEDEEGYIIYKNYLKFYNITENTTSYTKFKEIAYNSKEDEWKLHVNMPKIP